MKLVLSIFRDSLFSLNQLENYYQNGCVLLSLEIPLIGKRDQILRALFNEKVATSVSHQDFVTFWKKSVWS